jgi:hypothetical protein
MRISSLMAVMLVGFLAWTNVALAIPILYFKHESVYNSRFCKMQQCQFIGKSWDHSDGVDYDQYLYRLKNGLYFVAARGTNDSPSLYGYQVVISVSIETRATPKNLKTLETFLPQFIAETALGHRIDFQPSYRARYPEGEISYPDDGFFEILYTPSRRYYLNVICRPQKFNMISVTLYVGGRSDLYRSFGYNCDIPSWANIPACPWTSVAQPRRLF